MVRNHRETKQLAPAIQRPRFPRLRPISSLEIRQYEIGRDEMANRMNNLYPRFKTCFKIQAPREFKEDVEPWEVVDYYWHVLTQIAQDECLFVNLPEYFFEDQGLRIARVNEVDEFCGFGIGWIRRIDSNYRAWFKFILQRMIKFGCSTGWDWLDESSIIDFEEEQMMDAEDADVRAQFADSIEKIKYECAQEEKNSQLITSGGKKPIRLKKPKGKHEKAIYAAIKAGIEFVQAVDDSGKHMRDFYDEETANEYGTLHPGDLFLILDSWTYPSDVVQNHVLEWHIDDRAQNAGIAPFELAVPDDQEYTPELFDFTPINKLFAFHSHFYKLEQTFDTLCRK